jgi:hypothetical protein
MRYIYSMRKNPIRNVDGTMKRSYRKWSGMLRRCLSPTSHNYAWYGGRGITVCPEWQGHAGYDRFVEDMGEPPEGLTLERIDNAQGYSKANCKWATMAEQVANRRPRPQVPGSMRQLARAAGLPFMLVYLRVKRFGWTIEKALATPIQPRGRPVGWRKAKS